jgi:hypothetical protein
LTEAADMAAASANVPQVRGEAADFASGKKADRRGVPLSRERLRGGRWLRRREGLCCSRRVRLEPEMFLRNRFGFG